MIVTATEIKIKSLFGFFRFINHVRKTQSQIANADKLVFQKLKGFRTLTGWESEEAMKVFRNNGHHLNAMRNIKSMGKAKSITWETQSEPSWDEAIKKLKDIKFRT